MPKMLDHLILEKNSLCGTNGNNSMKMYENIMMIIIRGKTLRCLCKKTVWNISNL